MLSMWRSSGSTSSSFWMAELLTLSLRESPATIRRKLISAACIWDLILSVMTQSSCPFPGAVGVHVDRLSLLSAPLADS
ncbi:hypothetical protein ILYODFUR_028734 [Ilyodon furcidens]|uniref:Uncharacterized protein n=1 Tax=Ilyodon furcidens TaxID=33524 RepID=A0ABV0V7M4_9TELE